MCTPLAELLSKAFVTSTLGWTSRSLTTLWVLKQVELAYQGVQHERVRLLSPAGIASQRRQQLQVSSLSNCTVMISFVMIQMVVLYCNLFIFESMCLCVFVFTQVCMCVCLCLHKCVFGCACVCTCVCACALRRVCVCVCVRARVCVIVFGRMIVLACHSVMKTTVMALTICWRSLCYWVTVLARPIKWSMYPLKHDHMTRVNAVWTDSPQITQFCDMNKPKNNELTLTFSFKS